MILSGKRASGKTTALVKLSHQTGARIVCSYENNVRYIKEVADELELAIPEPISVGGNLDKLKGIKNEILIDDAELFLYSLLKKKVIAMTTSENVVKLDKGTRELIDTITKE